MLIQLQILNIIQGFRVYMIEKIQGLVGIYYQLQNNGATFLKCLFDGHTC